MYNKICAHDRERKKGGREGYVVIPVECRF